MTCLESEIDRAEELYANAEWRVFSQGMEHRQSGYAIEHTSLGARRRGGLWEWPLHLSEKSWCSPRLFHDAFLAALDLFGIEPDRNLTRSFAVGLASAPTSSRGPRAEAVRLGAVVPPRTVARKRPLREEGGSRYPVATTRGGMESRTSPRPEGGAFRRRPM